MKIHIDDIPDGGLDLAFNTTQDTRFSALMVDALGDLLPSDGEVRANLRLYRSEDTITLSGELTADLEPRCDRCLEPYLNHFEVAVEQYLVPLKAIDKLQTSRRSKRRDDRVGQTVEDLQLSTYRGRTIELDGLLKELLVLDLPARFLCDQDCRGLCKHCGVNLNKQSCCCHDELGESPFAALKALKHP